MDNEKRTDNRTGLQVRATLKIIQTENGRNLPPFDVEITDVSVSGIGFKSEHQLMIGEMLHGEISLWTKQKMEVIIKIVRAALEEEGYSYGSLFVGAQCNDSNRIKIYQLFNGNE